MCLLFVFVYFVLGVCFRCVFSVFFFEIFFQCLFVVFVVFEWFVFGVLFVVCLRFVCSVFFDPSPSP